MLLDGIEWVVRPDERWVVLGPNGCGKTSLLRIASLYLHPTPGTVQVLGEELGRCDVRTLRARIGLASQALADLLRPDLSAREVVVTARYAALEPWWHEYTAADRARAVGPARPPGRGVHGRAALRVALDRRAPAGAARPDAHGRPGPAAARRAGRRPRHRAREDLVERLGRLAVDPATPPAVLVTHHVEEIPAGFSHVLLLRAGRIVAAGPLPETLTEDALSDCFGVPVRCDRDGPRFSARIARCGRSSSVSA